MQGSDFANVRLSSPDVHRMRGGGVIEGLDRKRMDRVSQNVSTDHRVAETRSILSFCVTLGLCGFV
jgi:hypothetical protein